MDKFRNKYRIPSTRLQNWDYGWNAAYFVTICTANRELFFGDIVHDKMEFSEIGEIADKYWLEIPKHFPFVKLDANVVMPNHIHGIVIIDKTDYGRNHSKNDERNGDENGECNVYGNGGCNGGRTVETQNFASLQQQQQQQQQQPSSANKPQPKNKFGPQSQNLASIIRGFKTGVTKYARNNNIDFTWQSRFHDHIIRNNDEFNRIRNYIINNPANWNGDKFNNEKEGANG